MFGPTFWFGILVVTAWALQNFHEPVARAKVIYSTSRHRYWFGRLFYVGCAAFTYIVAVLFVLAIIKLIQPSLIQKDESGIHNGWVASSGAIIFMTIISYVSHTSRLIDYARNIAHNVALFPYQIEGLITDISHSAFRPTDDSNTGVLKELGRYGAMPASISDTITRPAMGSLVELYALRLRIHRFTSGIHFEEYREKNKDKLDDLDDLYRALFRRIGGFVALRERHDDVSTGVKSFFDDFSIVISEFASEAATQLVVRYRECLAGMALSYYSKPKERNDFLLQAGYNYVERRVLPFWSLAGLYCGYWIVFLALMVAVRVGIITIPNGSKLDADVVIVTVTGLAGSQMLAILWALVPRISKVTSDFVRPTNRELPYLSYVVFGLCSYLTGVVLSLLILVGSTDQAVSSLPWKGPFVFSLMNVSTTIGASVVIDYRLRLGNYDYRSWVIRDVLIMAVLLGLTNVAVQYIAELVGVPHSWQFVKLWTVVGVMVGYLLPASATTHLTALDSDIERDILEGTFIREVRER
jgi:hypothetical protein